ncbi:MAG: Response regulator receiver [Rhodocyclales bacterium]|nr:Response regulator receiver [Rhodocyclales bacterium]MDB5888701.1 Response regulator receiver [Rhodocyclales bacterium]
MRLFGWFRPKPIEPEPEDEYIVPNTALVMPVNRRARMRVDPRHGTQVLIIDDSLAVIGSLRKVLKSANCLVLEAGDAESGLEIARQERPHLIIIDVMLRGMNGYSALRKIRRDPDLCDTPVIVMSDNQKAAEYYFDRHSDADDFMKKPFTRQEVFVRLERLLDVNRVPRRIRPSDIMDDGAPQQA